MHPTPLAKVLVVLAIAVPIRRADSSPAPADTGTIRGTVVDPAGAGVAGVEVMVSALALATKADSTGRRRKPVRGGEAARNLTERPPSGIQNLGDRGA